jgi:drug/metabolite transporter (DMT)-like permease
VLSNSLVLDGVDRGVLEIVVDGPLGSQLVAVHACRLAPPQVLAPFDYTAMIWAVLLDIAIWHVLPSFTVVAGAGILMASGIYVVYREARAKRPIV